MFISTMPEMIGEAFALKLVDVGASRFGENEQASYFRALDGGNAQLVGFEPNPPEFARLQARMTPDMTYLPYAVGDGKRHTLNICHAAGMTSLLKPNVEVLSRFHGFPQWAQIVAQMELDTVRLDDVPETEGADFLQMDVQGFELTILQHATQRLSELLVIQTEVEFLPMYEGQPLFSEIELFLRGHGFVLHRIKTVSRMIAPFLINNDVQMGLSQDLWADAIFVRDFTKPQLLSDRQLLAMARLVHDLYGAYDLAMYLLIEYDTRRQTDYAARYTHAFTSPQAKFLEA